MSEYAVMPMSDYEGICDAVRAKTGGTAKLKSSEVKQAIEEIQTSSDPVIEPLSVTANGTYSAPDGVDGYNPVTVAIESGGGSATLWDRPYTSGSFTLAEDTSATYEIGDFSDWLKYTSDNGSTLTANYNIVAFLWRDVSAQTSMNSTLYCGAYQAIYINGGLSSTVGSCGYGRSSSAWSGIKNGGIYESNGILQALFTTTYLGYAGDTYHWLVTKVMV